MSKRYQVFVSSTFADLQDERSKVIQTLMEMDCIPAGMELFPAMDEEQFDFIKKIIDDCDYYLLIIGARYGSISEDDGLSYTEKEYRYAREKGMKVIALVHGEPEQLPVAKTDRDPALYDKLVEFRKDVCTNRLVRFWTSATELPGLVALNLPKTIKAYPAIGWVRGDSVTSNEALTELLSLKQENELLRKEIEQLSSRPKHEIENIAGLRSAYTLRGKGLNHSGKSTVFVKDTTFDQIYRIIAPILITKQDDETVRHHVEKELINLDYASMDEQCYQTIKLQFEALGLIDLTESNGYLYWCLTPLGRKTVVEAIVIRE
ncbi:DUF4062 domain-containing protein [Aeromonas dhakensis]|uniref:DUF4062 domain-containing protein n=1 Tax=Aeromonas dhakensis TaxID=196024 RepID=UPI001AB0016A|nr:DUF4062 domain-containing protein [Aeromonas dhakensis]MBO2901174.1 DUF4062 domain-containing protein [Aeromonas dhakensis]MBO2995961.1 DUF4062 domain-containing protein [Aeromonas dhakensis]